MKKVLSPFDYAEHVKYMSRLPAIQSLVTKRRYAEMIYFMHHKASGVRLRGKYRP